MNPSGPLWSSHQALDPADSWTLSSNVQPSEASSAGLGYAHSGSLQVPAQSRISFPHTVPSLPYVNTTIYPGLQYPPLGGNTHPRLQQPQDRSIENLQLHDLSNATQSASEARSGKQHEKSRSAYPLLCWKMPLVRALKIMWIAKTTPLKHITCPIQFLR